MESSGFVVIDEADNKALLSTPSIAIYKGPTVQLHPQQLRLKQDILAAWDAGARVVMGVLPTGGGKTVTVSSIIHDTPGASCSIAHRQELVGQISLAFAREGIRHRVIAQGSTVAEIAADHVEHFGRSFIDTRGAVAVAGVDTLIRLNPEDPWFRQVGRWVLDEGHHALKKNKWGRAAAMFPNAQGLLVTATPTRADGAGLGSHADGLADVLVEGPGMRWHIDNGYLTDYRIFAPPVSIDLSKVAVSAATGDYNEAQLRDASHRSTITGDVVSHYLKIAPGRLGITFAVDIQDATAIAARFRENGVPAEVVSSKTPRALRKAILAKFRRREILQLVNVDLFGEGFDLPAIEVVSFARPTASYSLYVQQFGRALRLLAGKDIAFIIDHVGNVVRHGLPDAPRRWSLDRREKRSASKSGPEALRTCLNPECLAPFERILLACPHCGHEIPPPADRSGPQFVDGDLHELDAETLAAMRGEIRRIDDGPQFPRGVDAAAAGAIKRRHWERQQAQYALRGAIATWGGVWRDRGSPDRESQKRFYLTFGVDIGSAQALNAADAEALRLEILRDLIAQGIDGTVTRA